MGKEMGRSARNLLLGLGALALPLLLADLAAACHSCGYPPSVRSCDWADEDNNGLDDSTGQPPSGATDHCRTCVIAGTDCDHDSDCPPAPGEQCGPTDGVITLCGGNGNNNLGFLNMSNSVTYQVCGAGGNDIITLSHLNPYSTHSPVYVDGGEGDDTITTIGYSTTGYTIYGGNGNDKIYGSEGPDTIYAATPPWHFTGDDVIYGNGGNDTITGSNRLLVFGLYVQGNNTIHGGIGNDVINGLSGRDALYGDAGNDTISTNEIADQNPATWAVTGTLLCGGPGNDTLNATGPAHQCLDGGVETNGTQGNDVCNYTFAAPGSGRSADVFDVGTKRNCNTDFLPVPCGCD